MVLFQTSSWLLLLTVTTSLLASRGCMVMGSGDPRELIVRYGDTVYLQNANVDNRWMTGGRSVGNVEVQTKNLKSAGEGIHTYRFTIFRKLANANSHDGDGDGEPDCVRYGDDIYLKVNIGVDRWLIAGFDTEDDSKVATKHWSGDYELYRWRVRSNLGNGFLDKENNHDPAEGARPAAFRVDIASQFWRFPLVDGCPDGRQRRN